jgi:hypothetical protein
MTIVWIIALLFIFLCVAIVFGINSQKRQEKQAALLQQIRRLNNQLNDIQQSITVLLQYDNNLPTQTAVLAFYKERINHLNTLAPNSNNVKDQQNEYIKFQKFIKQDNDNAEQIPRNEQETALVRKHLSHIIKMLSASAQIGLLTPEIAEEYNSRLKIKLLSMDVKLDQILAKDCAKKGDFINGSNYLKHAKTLIINFEIVFDQKKDMIKELNELNTLLFKQEKTQPDDDATLLEQQLDEQKPEVDSMGFPCDGNEIKKKF